LTGLPEILRASGWRSLLWIHNGDQTFYHRDRFYRPRGFQMIDGRDFPRDDPRTGWGYSDRALARRAIKALDRAPEPFAAQVLTVTNHHPFQVPSDAQSRFPLLAGSRRGFLSFLGLDNPMGLQTAPMLQTIHYTDEAVGDFFRLAASRPWFSRTVFVVTGDHGISIVPYRRQIHTLIGLTELRHRVPLILYSPLLPPGRVPGPASHVDVPETLLALAGVELPRPGVGRDLLDVEQYDPHRPVLLWSASGRLVTLVDAARLYQASLRIEPSSDERIRLSGEVLVDPAIDPDGEHNLLSAEPEATARYRRLARVYAEVYPWLIFSGRSGLPSSADSPAVRGPR
jgi:phosphoglycerol transferase MdoB-like AlkP superfamily enzyme